jgi:hypothetical protein
MVEQGLIEAGFNTLRSNDLCARLAGQFNTSIHQQALDHLADAKGGITRTSVHNDGLISG